MKAAIKRQPLNAVVEAFLDDLRFFHGDLRITLIAWHQTTMHDESGGIFIHQDLSSELNRLARFAAFVQLRMWLEHAEEFVAVGDRFPEQHAKTDADYMRLSMIEEDDKFREEQARLQISVKEQKRLPREILTDNWQEDMNLYKNKRRP